jgi:hypothetical protein
MRVMIPFKKGEVLVEFGCFSFFGFNAISLHFTSTKCRRLDMNFPRFIWYDFAVYAGIF